MDMDYKKFKKQFDKSFSKIKPIDFVNKMQSLGYVFKNIKNDDSKSK